MTVHTRTQSESNNGTDPQPTTQVPNEPNPNPLSLTKVINDDKPDVPDECSTTERDEKPTLLEVLRQQVKSFNGDDDAREWFKHIHSTFSGFNLTFDERLEIIPYFFEDNVFIWYTLNQDKFQSYAHLCQLFAKEYFNLEQTSDSDANANVKQSNKSFLLRSPAVVNKTIHADLINLLGDKAVVVDDQNTSLDPHDNHLSNSILSTTIAKALIDKFIKDPLKFSAGKENVITWIDEIEQQFNMMHLSNTDKLNLIHICLKGDVLQWFKQNKHKFTCWSIFVDEIKQSFASNLQRDLAFEKLKQYHQTVHQSATQYYIEMMKLMKQADPQMSESTKVRYLMNGLRPSLSTETRRNYPKNPEEFLVQSKIAEELTASNNTFPCSTINNNELPSPAFSYSNTNDPTTKNDYNDYRRNANAQDSYHDDNINYSSRDYNQHNFLNQISKPSFNSSRQTHAANSSSQKFPSSYNANPRRNNYFQHNSQSIQRCFKCGSAAHIARHCYHFGNRSQ